MAANGILILRLVCLNYLKSSLNCFYVFQDALEKFWCFWRVKWWKYVYLIGHIPRRKQPTPIYKQSIIFLVLLNFLGSFERPFYYEALLLLPISPGIFQWLIL